MELVLSNGVKIIDKALIKLLLKRQEEAGNKPDLGVFERWYSSGTANGGFNWEETPEGSNIWQTMLSFGFMSTIEKKKLSNDVIKFSYRRENKIITMATYNRYITGNCQLGSFIDIIPKLQNIFKELYSFDFSHSLAMKINLKNQKIDLKLKLAFLEMLFNIPKNLSICDIKDVDNNFKLFNTLMSPYCKKLMNQKYVSTNGSNMRLILIKLKKEKIKKEIYEIRTKINS